MERDSIDWLSDVYLGRKKGNAHYSLRAFARQTGIAPGSLSELLSRRRRLTWKTALRIADRLDLSPQQRREFLSGVSYDPVPVSASEGPRTRQLDEDAFQVVAEWPHYAVLSLMETKGFRSDPRWIGRRLGMDPVEVRQMLGRMERLNLIHNEDGRWVPGQDWVTTSHDVPSNALKRAHHRMLEKAAEAVDEVPVELRDVTYVTMAIDPDKIPLAKQLIRQFRRTMVEVLESGNQREVYNINIQLIPLTRIQKTKGEDNAS